MCGRKLLFPERSIKMIDGSKECKCQLASELQDLCVFEKHSKEEVTQSKNGTEEKIEFVSIWFCQMGHSYERKKIQFTTTNTFYFFVISHMHPCVYWLQLYIMYENNLLIYTWCTVDDTVHDDQRVGSGKAQNFYKCSYM